MTNNNISSTLITTIDSQGAFKGTKITNALSSFIESVKSVSISYLNALQEAENQIIETVYNAYQQQDTEVSGQINSDSSSVDSARVNLSGK